MLRSFETQRAVLGVPARSSYCFHFGLFILTEKAMVLSKIDQNFLNTGNFF